MKKNRRGNIRDIVLEATLVTPSGTIETHRRWRGPQPGCSRCRCSSAARATSAYHQALIAIHPKPEECRYASLLVRSFGEGSAWLRALRAGRVLPASIRLVNNREFRCGQALKPAAHGVKAVKDRLQRALVTRVLGFDPKAMAACTIVMEGTRREVEEQERELRRIAKQFRALWTGAENGRRGYTLTFAIGYLRDFMSGNAA